MFSESQHWCEWLLLHLAVNPLDSLIKFASAIVSIFKPVEIKVTPGGCITSKSCFLKAFSYIVLSPLCPESFLCSPNLISLLPTSVTSHLCLISQQLHNVTKMSASSSPHTFLPTLLTRLYHVCHHSHPVRVVHKCLCEY